MTKPHHSPISVRGIDFTSRPTARKPITCVYAQLAQGTLRFKNLARWDSFAGFETMVAQNGPWIAGMDFPFAQPRKLVSGVAWPLVWGDCIDVVGALSRVEFRQVLEDYKRDRPAGDRHHRRECDRLAASQSPQTLYGTPVGLMFYEGAVRLKRSGVHLPHHQAGDRDRIVLETYPGLLARSILGRRAYKNDTRAKQTQDQAQARQDLLNAMIGGECLARYGFALDAPSDLAQDPGADDLDALLCAIQAAWGWLHRDQRFGAPAQVDRLEGWICDPALRMRPAHENRMSGGMVE
ncbi:MAG: DUF429 domain-containing protein [Proteobacteria bacterium]|nr:DUF429 domain-containing protein [Pseudomonadota bacterium]